MTTDDSVDVARGTAKVKAILRTNGSGQQDSTPSREQQQAQLQGAKPERKKRADAGKPRTAINIDWPGVKIDFSMAEGKQIFWTIMRGMVAQGDTRGLFELAGVATDALLAQIDRLRAAK